MNIDMNSWYKVDVDRREFKKLAARSDARGLLQVGGFLGLVVATGVLAYFSLGTMWVVPAFMLYGTVFAFSLSNHLLKTLHAFADDADGGYPAAGLLETGGVLYGICQFGGLGSGPGNGTLFSLNDDGTGFKTLHQFTGYSSSGSSESRFPTGSVTSSMSCERFPLTRSSAESCSAPCRPCSWRWPG